MKYFKGNGKKKSYFEGWYFKQSNGSESIALIPAYHVDQAGHATASIQVISGREAVSVEYPAEDFYAEENRFFTRIGRNTFSRHGMDLDIELKDMQIRGQVEFSPFTGIKGDIMGPFRRIPFMQCNHGVLSLFHRVTGELEVSGKTLRFDDGIGYIEKDWGSSFPKSYLWTQDSWVDESGGDTCVMVSIAHIPLMGLRFTGCICCMYTGGREQRLATYRGTKIRRYSNTEVELEQGGYRLWVELIHGDGQDLKAPARGSMDRIIKESLCADVRYRYWVNGRLIIDRVSNQASFETSGF